MSGVVEGDVIVASGTWAHQESVSSAQTNQGDLVAQARAGDKVAFGELVRINRAQAYGWAKSVTRDHHLSEDIVQDAFIRAWKYRHDHDNS